ncbi:MAG TPA: hypothetical protein VIV06_09575, partial [Candidatus Limnocylindrales bacterium]
MLLLVDLDGVVYRGAEPVPGVADVLADRATRGDDIVYVTNNSMHYRADYLSRLTAMGAPVSADRIVSSARATAIFLVEGPDPVRRVLAVGMSGLRHELADVGLDVVDAADLVERLPAGPGRPLATGPDGLAGPGAEWSDPTANGDGREAFDLAGRPQALVVGLDLRFSYRVLAFASDVVRAGARFVATNRDPVFP